MLATPVDGLPLYGRATIWGSESKDAWNSTLNLSWRKHPNEVTRQVATSAFIRSEFDQNGYSASDYQGVKGSDKNSILYQIQTNQANYPRVAVVDFDHGNGNNETHLMGAPDNEFHYMFEDQRGTYSGPVCHPYPPDHREYGVYDMEIYPWTGSGKYFFVLINACNSAHNDTTFGQYPSSQGIIPGTNRARGMPFAWTHRLVENRDTYQGFNTAYHMSDDGYARPDNGEFVYLGFYMGSAALTQDVAAKDGSMRPYWYWLEHFISYAVRNNWSVKQALNEASQQFYGGSFGEIPLHTNYISIWPTFYKNATESQPSWHNDYGPNSQMRVYGNSNIKLYQPLLTLAANGGLSPTFTIDGQAQYAGSNLRLISKVYTINVNDIPNYAFSHFSYQGANYGRPANIQIASDGVLTAYYNWNPTYYTLSISSSGGGHTEPTGDRQCLSYTYEHVEAVPDPDWTLDHWQLGNDNMGCNPTIDVYMNGPKTLQAVFVPAPSYKFVNSITGCDGDIYSPASLVGWQNDGQFAEIRGWGPYQYYGWISGALNAQSAGRISVYGYGDGPLYVYTSNDGYNWNLFSTPYVNQWSPHWIDCGINNNPFNYIMFTAEDWNCIYTIGIDSVRVEPVTYHTLTISSNGDGHTNPSGNPSYLENTYAHVTAQAHPGWRFDYWSLDYNPVSSDPSIDVYMDNDHNLQANFVEDQNPIHYINVHAVDTYFNEGQPLTVNVYVDGNWRGYSYQDIPVNEGYHYIEVDGWTYDPVFGDIPFYYWTDDGWNIISYDNPTYMNINTDMTITAWYNCGWFRARHDTRIVHATPRTRNAIEKITSLLFSIFCN